MQGINLYSASTNEADVEAAYSISKAYIISVIITNVYDLVVSNYS